MYNRYIPQSDGTYRRNRMQEVVSTPERQIPVPPPQPPQNPEPQPQHCSSCLHNPAIRRPAPVRENRRRDNTGSVTGFLKQLLPKDFDVEDLVVVLLLLLMAGDNQENQNTALLTLALYLFL